MSLLVASLMFSFAAYPAYAYGVYRQGTRPTRPTWLMILVSDLLLFGFMLAEGRWDWLTLGFSAGNLLVLALSAWVDVRSAQRAADRAGARIGTPDLAWLAVLGRDPWTTRDIASVAVALAALALWAMTGSGIAAISFTMVAKIAGSVPMWFNLYREPERENILPWAIWTIGGALYLISIPRPEWRFASLAVPMLFLTLECIVIGLLLRRFEALPRSAIA